MSQSTNDAYPTSFKLAFIFMNEELVADLKLLIQAFRAKGEEFKEVLKMGRTQLQDAVPMTMGQEFEAFAANLEEEVDRLNQMAKLFLEVNMGQLLSVQVSIPNRNILQNVLRTYGSSVEKNLYWLLI